MSGLRSFLRLLRRGKKKDLNESMRSVFLCRNRNFIVPLMNVKRYVSLKESFVDVERRNGLFQRMRDFETRGLYEESDALFEKEMQRDNERSLGIVRNDRNAIDLHGCDRLSAECVLRYTLRGIARGNFHGMST